MSATEAVNAIKEHFESFVKSAEEKLEQDLPKVESAVTAAESNPVVQAVASATHLSEIPEALPGVASLIGFLDSLVGSAKAKGAAEAAAPETPAPPAA
jgi:hypothetical protein